MDCGEPMVLFRDGQVIPCVVVEWMRDVERRGGRFEITPTGAWRVLPHGTLNILDLRFMCGRWRWTQIHQAIGCLSDDALCFRD